MSWPLVLPFLSLPAAGAKSAPNISRRRLARDAALRFRPRPASLLSAPTPHPTSRYSRPVRDRIFVATRQAASNRALPTKGDTCPTRAPTCGAPLSPKPFVESPADSATRAPNFRKLGQGGGPRQDLV